jgi:hypothetical protein
MTRPSLTFRFRSGHSRNRVRIREAHLFVRGDIPTSKDSEVVNLSVSAVGGDSIRLQIRVARVVDEPGYGTTVTTIDGVMVLVISCFHSN